MQMWKREPKFIYENLIKNEQTRDFRKSSTVNCIQLVSFAVFHQYIKFCI